MHTIHYYIYILLSNANRCCIPEPLVATAAAAGNKTLAVSHSAASTDAGPAPSPDRVRPRVLMQTGGSGRRSGRRRSPRSLRAAQPFRVSVTPKPHSAACIARHVAEPSAGSTQGNQKTRPLGSPSSTQAKPSLISDPSASLIRVSDHRCRSRTCARAEHYLQWVLDIHF